MPAMAALRETGDDARADDAARDVAAADVPGDAVHQVRSRSKSGVARHEERGRGRGVGGTRRRALFAASVRRRGHSGARSASAVRASSAGVQSDAPWRSDRKPTDQSLFDDLDPATAAATGGALGAHRRGRLVRAAAGGPGTTDNVAAARSGAVALPQLRAVGHHGARAARRARRPQAGAAPHPLHDVAAEPDGRRQAPQVREGRRRRDGQLPPARRRRALRDARAHGAALLAALSARRRLGQLRLARRRQRRGDALHRVPARAHQRRDARPRSSRRRSTSARTTTARRPSRSSCRRAFRTCSSTARPGIAVGMATNIPPHNLGEVCTALVKLLDNRGSAAQRAALPLHQGTRFPDRRPDPQFAGRAQGDLRDRARARSGCAARGTSGRRRESTKTIYIDSIPYTVNKAQLVERIAEVVLSRKLPQLARREGPVDRGRAHRARDEEGRRREDGHGVPLQAHAAADQLRRQPDVPRCRPRTRRSAAPSGSI